MYFSIPFSLYPYYRQGGRFLSMFSYETENRLKLNQTVKEQTGADRRPPTAAGRPPAADRRPPPTSEVLRASSYPPRVSMARFARGLPTPGRAEARPT